MKKINKKNTKSQSFHDQYKEKAFKFSLKKNVTFILILTKK